MDQVEDRTSELEDKVEELDNPSKEYLKNEKHMKGPCRNYWTIKKITKRQITGIEEESQVTGLNQIFNSLTLYKTQQEKKKTRLFC